MTRLASDAGSLSGAFGCDAPGVLVSPTASEFHQALARLVKVHDREVAKLREELLRARSCSDMHTDLRTTICLSGKAALDDLPPRNHEPRSNHDDSVADGPVPAEDFEKKEAFERTHTSPVNVCDEVSSAVPPRRHSWVARMLGSGNSAETAGVEAYESAASLPPSSPSMGGRKRPKSRLVRLINKREPTRFERLLAGPIDTVMGVAITVNAMLLFFDLERRGWELGAELGTSPVEHSWRDTAEFFNVLEHAFNGLFLLELIFRMGVLRKQFFVDADLGVLEKFNLFDLCLVTFCTLDLWVLPALQGSAQGNITFMRLVRLVRLSRGLKVIRVMKAFAKLRILLRTVAASFMALLWSMVLLGLLNFGAAIFLCQLLQPSLLDEELKPEIREFIFEMYGTSARALWTMFEFTHSGGWPNYARPIVESVHWAYALFFALYVSVVVFAVTRIITALFLKDTLQIAANDSDMMIQEHLQKTKKYVEKLRDLFELADRSGDGMVSLEELEDLCNIPEVRIYMHLLELEFYEVQGLFNLLDPGRGKISLTEFIGGVLRLKGQARSMDMVAVNDNCYAIQRRCEEIQQKLLEHTSTLDELSSNYQKNSWQL